MANIIEIDRINNIIVMGTTGTTTRFPFLTASRMAYLNGESDITSVSDLTTWVGGTANQITSSDDSDGTLTLSIPNPFAIPGKLTAGSFGSPLDVTNAREYGVELHYSGNNYNTTAIRARAHAVTTDTSAQFQGALLQAANNDNINVGVLNGALIEAIGKATTNAATISMMRGCLVNTEWSAKDTVTDLRVLHVRTHTRDAATEGYVSGTGYGVYIENEAVGGNGQALDAGIYFKGTNLSAGNKAFTYGIDFSDATYETAEIKLSNGGTISNLTAGQIGINGNLSITVAGANDATIIFNTATNQINVYLDESATNDTIVFAGQTAAKVTNLYVEALDGYNAVLGLYSGNNKTLLYKASTDDTYLRNYTEDKDLIFQINDGGAQKTITWDADVDQLVHSAGTFNFNSDVTVGDGGVTNYLNVDGGGRVLLVGTAQTWEDIRIVPGAFQFPGVADPTLQSWQPGGAGATYKVYKFLKNDEVHFTCQIPHNYKEGSDLKPHLHWTPCDRGNEENGNTVGWKIDYSWANYDAAFASSATIDLSDACSGIDDQHEKTDSGTITGTNKTISGVLQIRLYRSDTDGDDTWVGATAALSPAILEFDLHYEIDSLGSDLELVKDAP